MPAVRKAASRKAVERKPTLSPTRISTYLECAVKYRYIYQDKIGRFYTKARAGYSFGTTLHQVLEEFHAQGETQTATELVTQMEVKWIGAGYKTPEQEQTQREVGEQIVQAYHHASQERKTAQVETFATEKTITTDMGLFKLSGRVDRIDRHPDGSLEIIDYKSGRWETTSEEVANSLAMNIYQVILKRLHPDARVFATIYCLRSGISASAEMSEEERTEFERELLTLGEEILTTDYADLLPVWQEEVCSDCDFQRICSRYWREQDAPPPPDAPHYEEG